MAFPAHFHAQIYLALDFACAMKITFRKSGAACTVHFQLLGGECLHLHLPPPGHPLATPWPPPELTMLLNTIGSPGLLLLPPAGQTTTVELSFLSPTMLNSQSWGQTLTNY